MSNLGLTYPAEKLLTLRYMDRETAELEFDLYEVPEEERVNLRKLVGTKVQTATELKVVPSYAITTQDPFRNHWMATAWVLGASYRMLGKMHGITHQTVVQAVNKRLSAQDRAGRLGFMLEPERISEYHKAYYDNKLLLANMTPLDAAIWLVPRVQHDALDADPRYEG